LPRGKRQHRRGHKRVDRKIPFYAQLHPAPPRFMTDYILAAREKVSMFAAFDVETRRAKHQELSAILSAHFFIIYKLRQYATFPVGHWAPLAHRSLSDRRGAPAAAPADKRFAVV
ncbi:MAG: hypothetical protein IKS52_09740, partial [Clostridia bacterium]|nr:hypothetical protein [Clostridia bacterium]